VNTEEGKTREQIDENEGLDLQAERVLLDKAEKAFKVYSVNKMREMIKYLLDNEYLLEYRTLVGEKFRLITLGKKGYDLVHNCYQTLGVLEIENSKRERSKLLENMDTENYYRHFRIHNINVYEYDHHDYIVKLKIALQYLMNKPVIMHDYLKENSELFRNKDRSDLLVRIADKEYVAIEYEKTLKTAIKYLGSKYESNGRMINISGFFKARQDPAFLPHGNKIRWVIVICDNESIMRSLIRYLDTLATPKMRGQDAGKYTVLDKFFFIDKSKYDRLSLLLKEGVLLSYRKQRIGDKVDYVQSTFGSLLSA
jgi:hypothetical protein